MEELITQSQQWIAANGREFLLNIVLALVIFIVGRWAAKLVRRSVRKLMRRSQIEETLTRFGANIVYALVLAFVVIAALGQLGVQTASFVAIVGAAGLAIGLAMQGALANFAAGVMVILFRPFRAGDYVEAAGTSGTVEEIEIFQTRLLTPDNKVVIVPNAAITGDTITNYSAMDTRRVDMVIRVHHASDLVKTRDLLTEIITRDERVLREPAPTIVVGELGENSIDFLVRPWCNAGDYWPLKWDMNLRIRNRLEEAGIVIPFPQMDVHLFNESHRS